MLQCTFKSILTLLFIDVLTLSVLTVKVSTLPNFEEYALTAHPDSESSIKDASQIVETEFMT